jgi:hypothetical protein
LGQPVCEESRVGHAVSDDVFHRPGAPHRNHHRPATSGFKIKLDVNLEEEVILKKKKTILKNSSSQPH